MSAKNLKNRAAKPVRKPAKAPVRAAAKATSKAKPKAATAAKRSGSEPAKASSGTKAKPAAVKRAVKANRGATKATSPTRPKAGKTVPKSAPAPRKTAAVKASPAPRAKAPTLASQDATKPPKTPAVTAKKSPASEASKAPKASKSTSTSAAKVEDIAKVASAATAAEAVAPVAKPKASRTTLDDLALDVDEKDELLEQEKRDLAKALRDDDDEPLETAFIPTDTSERFILVVDEEGQRRNETVTIVQQILPNAVIEVADDPEEALEVMEEADFDTYVVNFLMPGYSASPFVKAVANHPDHPLLIGFAADKISDALDQRKGLKIIPLKRLFDLDVAPGDAAAKDKAGAEE